jgi:cyclomaltodextrinase / maltogenic alpha-amylase / neopullulanase
MDASPDTRSETGRPNPPGWISDAIFYQIFPDRFATSSRVPKPSGLEDWDSPPTTHGYKGGDLLGIVDRLDYLADLGINAIYLNPIFWSASNHRYHTYDYYVVDPLLGGNDAFDTLLAACHERRIRVVIDGVFNHASRGFFAFHDVAENGASSPWKDWFHVDGFPLHPYEESKPANYWAWWGLRGLPKLNTENADVREYLMRIAEHWIERGADGWRLDVPQEIKTEGFWEEFRSRVKAINPDAYIVGEIWDNAAEWISDGSRFDGTMNYLFAGYTLAYAAGHRIAYSLASGQNYPLTPALDAPSYRQRIDDLIAAYPAEAAEANLTLLGSHDTSRILSVAGGDIASVELSALLQFTFPGAPSIYYGDEIGMKGTGDPASRGSFPWEHRDSWNDTVRSTMQSLISLRREHTALRRGTFTSAAASAGMFVFTRANDDERLVVAVNAGDSAASVSMDGPLGAFHAIWGEGGIKPDHDTVLVALPPRSGAVWKVS